MVTHPLPSSCPDWPGSRTGRYWLLPRLTPPSAASLCLCSVDWSERRETKRKREEKKNKSVNEEERALNSAYSESLKELLCLLETHQVWSECKQISESQRLTRLRPWLQTSVDRHWGRLSGRRHNVNEEYFLEELTNCTCGITVFVVLLYLFTALLSTVNLIETYDS